MKLIRHERRPAEWDKVIGDFPNKSLFHESAWLDFVVATTPYSRVEYFEIRRDGKRLGYFSAIRVRKFLLNFWERPWNCVYMSPLVSPQIDKRELVQLLVTTCRKEHIAYLELCDPWLEQDIMESFGFVTEHHVSHVCPLTGGKDSAWANMDSTCRTRIRKAEKSGLTAEPVTDMGFIEEFYNNFDILLKRKGKSPTYGIDYVRKLFVHLGGADRLFALRVKHEGKTIGTAYYPHDERAMYFGDSAYELESLPLCPNNLLHWTAMQMAIERSIPSFYIGGDPQPSRFSRKFGGTLQPVIRYHRSFVPLLHQARKAYHLVKEWKARILYTLIWPIFDALFLANEMYFDG